MLLQTVCVFPTESSQIIPSDLCDCLIQDGTAPSDFLTYHLISPVNMGDFSFLLIQLTWLHSTSAK